MLFCRFAPSTPQVGLLGAALSTPANPTRSCIFSSATALPTQAGRSPSMSRCLFPPAERIDLFFGYLASSTTICAEELVVAENNPQAAIFGDDNLHASPTTPRGTFTAPKTSHAPIVVALRRCRVSACVQIIEKTTATRRRATRQTNKKL